ncbi:MAG: response regulator [Nitrospira sp.]|nr:response regulator [Nitrospira sp.]HBP87882.1 two-component system response regulator [Nitrospiraceae bacterium]HNP29382.1 response regulator [Nitrospirales bacterium]
MSHAFSPRQSILLIEDSPEDAEATLRSFQKSGLRNPIKRCENGDEALAYLFKKNPDQDQPPEPPPGLILLDLNLPGTDGREVLRTVKADPKLKKIPVIVLTTSSDERDIESCYQDGANSYIVKPVEAEGLFTAVLKLKDYWFELVVFPKPD